MSHWAGLPVTVAVLCHELESGEARLQEAALELSLPVVRVDGLAVSRREAAGGGALSGVVSGFAADVVARRRHLASQSSGLVCGQKDVEVSFPDVV